MKQHHSAGFTLIELLIATALTAFIMVSASYLLVSTLSARGKTAVRQTLKAEGQFVQNQVDTALRSAKAPITCITDEETGVSSTILFYNSAGEAHQFSHQPLAAVGTPIDAIYYDNDILVSDAVTITDLSFRCENARTDRTQVGGGSDVYITTTFQVHNKDASGGAGEIYELFRSGVLIRNTIGQ